MRLGFAIRGLAIGTLALAVGASRAPAQDAEKPAEPAKPAPRSITAEERDEALVKAFAYLDDEIWKMQEGGSPRKQYTAATMAWAYLLAADKRGKGAKKLPSRKKQLDRLRGYLSQYVEQVVRVYDRDDEKAEKERTRPGMPPGFAGMRTSQYVWPLGIAAHYFAESLERGKSKKDSKEALRGIVRVLEAAQQESGGWGHDDASRPGMGLPPVKIPKPGGGSQEYPGTLLGASNCALSGLGVAHEVLGTTKKTEALERGITYFRESQDEGGTFPYDPSQRMGQDRLPEGAPEGSRVVQRAGFRALSVARTSGGVLAMLCAGAKKDDPDVRRALDAVDAHPEWASEGHGSASMALQLAAVLARARGDETWAAFRRTYFARILGKQQEDGSFDCACEEVTFGVTCDTKPLPGMGKMPGMDGWTEQARVYVTAIHALILLLDRCELESVPEMPGLAAEVTPR
jgi:hypothetical protein